MQLVDDWKHGAAMVELYADPRASDGYLILFESTAPEHAADIADTTGRPRVSWKGLFAERDGAWRRTLSADIRRALAAWSR